jgi:ankyrin repeat protein
MREHLNASPCKLRTFIKNQIFVNDDVDYLKRLVSDIGGMDYVFRFLWYDGPVPATITPNAAASRPEDATEATSFGNHENNRKRVGRTWIQYCCYWNAHKCLQWIFEEIIRNHLHKKHQHQLESSLTSIDQQGEIVDDEHYYDITTEENSEEQQNLKIIQQLLEFPSTSYCGANYVAVATIRNSHQCLSLLLEYGGIDPNMTVNAHGSTAAHLSAWKNHVECLRVLKSGVYGCHVVTGDDDNEDESLSESQASNNETFDVPFKEPPEFSPEAIKSVPTGKEHGWKADWNKTNAQGETVLHIAAREGHKETMIFFLNAVTESATSKKLDENVIDFSITNRDGMDSIAIAAMNGHAEIIKMVSDSIDYLSKEVLSITIRGTHANQFMLPLSPMHRKETPIQHQPTPNRRRVQSEPYNNVSNYQSDSVKKAIAAQPLHRSTKNNILPSHFPSLNFRNTLDKCNHQTPLHVAAQCGHCNTIEALIESDYCEATARDSLGQTALHVAASENHLDACQMLVYLASDIFEEFDVVDVLGRTPLYIACSQGNVSLARILIAVSNWRVLCHERKKSPDGPLYVNIAHQPPFHAAVVNNHLETARVLLDAGVDVDQTDIDGRTALSAAAKLGLYDMCEMLISYGADVNKRSSRGGPTPFQKVSGESSCSNEFVRCLRYYVTIPSFSPRYGTIRTVAGKEIQAFRCCQPTF